MRANRHLEVEGLQILSSRSTGYQVVPLYPELLRRFLSEFHSEHLDPLTIVGSPLLAQSMLLPWLSCCHMVAVTTFVRLKPAFRSKRTKINDVVVLQYVESVNSNIRTQ